VEAHFIANKDEIQAECFNLEVHVHNVFGQERHSGCGLLASRLHNQCRCLLQPPKKLPRAIENKQRGMLSWGVAMIRDNTCPHTAMQYLIMTFHWEQFDHPPYSPDLSPSDFHLFLYLKSFLAGRRFHEDSEVKEATSTCFS